MMRHVKECTESDGGHFEPTLSAVTHKLNVTRHMLLWKFLLFWYVQLMLKVRPHLPFTLCIKVKISLLQAMEAHRVARG
jgi:hypothetical protein